MNNRQEALKRVAPPYPTVLSRVPMESYSPCHREDPDAIGGRGDLGAGGIASGLMPFATTGDAVLSPLGERGRVRGISPSP